MDDISKTTLIQKDLLKESIHTIDIVFTNDGEFSDCKDTRINFACIPGTNAGRIKSMMLEKKKKLPNKYTAEHP